MAFQIIPVAEASAEGLMASINKVIINPIIILLFALAVVYFLYGLAMYFIAPDNEEIKKTNKKHMLWGIFGMFIMVAVFGIMRIITSTLGVTNVEVTNSGYTIK